MKNEKINISGMSCPHCVMAVKKALSELPLAAAKVEIGSAKVKYDPEKVKLDTIVQSINQTGYTVIR